MRLEMHIIREAHKVKDCTEKTGQTLTDAGEELLNAGIESIGQQSGD